MIRIALDAMGGDNAPQIEVEGTAQALQELPPEFLVQLVGRKAEIESALAKHPGVDAMTRQVNVPTLGVLRIFEPGPPPDSPVNRKPPP
jgi:fatty acid/phospholipid biosynthesis enzyme